MDPGRLCGRSAFVHWLTANPEKLSKKQHHTINLQGRGEHRVPGRSSSGPDGCLALAVFTESLNSGAETIPLMLLRVMKQTLCSP